MKLILNLRKSKKGFTLIELIVVIAILAILAIIAVPRLASLQSNARIDADRTTARQIVNMAKTYIADMNLTNTAAEAAGTVTVAKLVEAGLLDTAPITQVTKTAFVLTVTKIAAVAAVGGGTPSPAVPEHLRYVVTDTTAGGAVNIFDSEVVAVPYGAAGVFIKSGGN